MTKIADVIAEFYTASMAGPDFDFAKCGVDGKCSECSEPIRLLFAGMISQCDACLERQDAAHWSGFCREAIAPARASIPDYYGWACFAAPEMTQRVRPGAALRLRTRGARNTLLLGPSGAGKTSLAVAGLNELFRRAEDGRPAVTAEDRDAALALAEGRVRRVGTSRFIRAFELAEAHLTAPLGQGEPLLVQEARNAYALVLDEMGPERDRARPLLVDIVQSRTESRRVTFITSAKTPPEMLALYGEGFMRRMGGSNGVIECQ